MRRIEASANDREVETDSARSRVVSTNQSFDRARKRRLSFVQTPTLIDICSNEDALIVIIQYEKRRDVTSTKRIAS